MLDKYLNVGRPAKTQEEKIADFIKEKAAKNPGAQVRIEGASVVIDKGHFKWTERLPASLLPQ